MSRIETKFDIVRFTPDGKQYYPASMEHEDWMPDNYVKHTEMDVALGQSRYGGPVIDLPEGVEHPQELRFAGQLDLAKFSPFDASGLLPKTGQLIFFADLLTDTGKVIYADVPNERLIRTVREHEDNFFSGVLVDNIFAETETLAERFREDSDEEDGQSWDYFAGTEKSKIFGIYTHCQYEQKEIEEMAFSEMVLLLQVGEAGFNDDGVFSVTIPKDDLKNLVFDRCEFAWGQS